MIIRMIIVIIKRHLQFISGVFISYTLLELATLFTTQVLVSVK